MDVWRKWSKSQKTVICLYGGLENMIVIISGKFRRKFITMIQFHSSCSPVLFYFNVFNFYSF